MPITQSASICQERVPGKRRERNGKVVLSQAIAARPGRCFLRNLPKCLIGMEACGSAHHWGAQAFDRRHVEKARSQTVPRGTRDTPVGSAPWQAHAAGG